MNVSMPIAAVLLDLDFPPAMIKAIPLLARTAGLLAHLAEEQARPIGFLMASKAEEAIGYDGGDEAVMLDPEIESLPWTEPAAADDALYRRQIAYLFANSRFYRDKLAAAGFARRRASAASTTSPRSRSPRRTSCARAAAKPSRSAPISPCPLTDTRPHLLDQRHHRHAELHPADRRRPRELDQHLGPQLRRRRREARRRPDLDLQCRAFRRRRGAATPSTARPLPYPGRHRQHRAPDGGASGCSSRRRSR